MTGLMLILPMAAEAREASFVSASRIEGVKSVDLLADGSVRLELVNWQVVTVSAESVRVSETGEVSISAAAADVRQ